MDPELVRSLEDERWALMARRDVGALDELLDARMTYVHSTGTVQSKEQFLDLVDTGDLTYLGFARHGEQASVTDHTVVLTGTGTITTHVADRSTAVDVTYSAVWARSGAHWRFLHWHSTRLA